MSTSTSPDFGKPRHWLSAMPKAIGCALLICCSCGLAISATAESALSVWIRIKDQGSCEDFSRFVRDHGDTPLAALARQKVEDCEAKEAAAAEAARLRKEAEERERARREAEQRADREAAEKAASEHLETKERAWLAHPELDCGDGFWSGEQLQRLFVNQTWEGIAGTTKWQEFYSADGTLRGRAWKSGQRRPDYSGRWYLSDDRYCYCTEDCLSYACRKVLQDGCKTWTWDIEHDRKRSQVTKISQGNPSKL